MLLFDLLRHFNTITDSFYLSAVKHGLKAKFDAIEKEIINYRNFNSNFWNSNLTWQMSTCQRSSNLTWQMSTSQMSTSQMSTCQMSTWQMSTCQMSTCQMSTSQMITWQMSTSQMSTWQMSTWQMSTSQMSTWQMSTWQMSSNNTNTTYKSSNRPLRANSSHIRSFCIRSAILGLKCSKCLLRADSSLRTGLCTVVRLYQLMHYSAVKKVVRGNFL